MFVLDSLSNSINIYGKDCKLALTIIPEAAKLNPELIIINIGFSREKLRVNNF